MFRRRIGTIETTRTTETTSIMHLDRNEFYPDDWGDRGKFEAIIWKRSQTTETNGKIKAIPEIITVVLVIGGKGGLGASEV